MSLYDRVLAEEDRGAVRTLYASGNVRPGAPLLDVGDGALADAERCGDGLQRFSGLEALSDARDVGLDELRLPVLRPSPVVKPTLSRAVFHVPLLGAEEQVVRIHAGRCVAGVADIHSRGDAPFFQQVGYPMGTLFFSPSDVPVPVVVHRPCPEPASALRATNSAPESCLDWGVVREARGMMVGGHRASFTGSAVCAARSPNSGLSPSARIAA